MKVMARNHPSGRNCPQFNVRPASMRCDHHHRPDGMRCLALHHRIMKRLSKLVAMLTLLATVVTPASTLLAHSACRLTAESPASGCHFMRGRHSSSIGSISDAGQRCCQIAPLLPAKITPYAVARPTMSLLACNVAPTEQVLDDPRSTAANRLHSPSHCLRQAFLCTFLI
jgi:hypothetical protein